MSPEVEAFYEVLRLTRGNFVLPDYVQVFIARFNQEQRGLLIAVPWSSNRLVEVYCLAEQRLRCSVPYEAFQFRVTQALDALGAAHGRSAHEITNYAEHPGF